MMSYHLTDGVVEGQNGESTHSRTRIWFARPAANTYNRTQFTHGKFVTRCHWIGGSSTSYFARPTGFAGGSSIVRPGSAPTAYYCNPYVKESGFNLVTTRAITWTNGLDTTGILVLSLSTQTGYSTQAELSCWLHVAGQLCGVGGHPGFGSPDQIVAKQVSRSRRNRARGRRGGRDLRQLASLRGVR
jgi:hypothetical protein